MTPWAGFPETREPLGYTITRDEVVPLQTPPCVSLHRAEATFVSQLAPCLASATPGPPVGDRGKRLPGGLAYRFLRIYEQRPQPASYLTVIEVPKSRHNGGAEVTRGLREGRQERSHAARATHAADRGGGRASHTLVLVAQEGQDRV
mgnify:FL=1